MDKCNYKELPNNDKRFLKLKKSSDWKPFLKQLLICSGVWMSVFLFGLSVGAPTVFIPQIRREANNTEVITNEMASWLTAAYGFSGFPFVLILSILTKFVGRKIPFVIAVLDSLAAFIVLYWSTSVTHILISQIMQGMFCAAHTTVTIMIMTEYISPKYRGIFLTAKIATFYWGVWASNTIGTFFHWKNIPLFGMGCTMYTLLTLMIWPESPYWLASRGRFEECAASHRSLKGCDDESEKELEVLINSQRQYLAGSITNEVSVIKQITGFFKIITSKEFCKPTGLSILTALLSACSGKLIFALYAVDVLKQVTKDESTAYYAMLIIDGFTVSSMYAGCALAKHLKRRTLLLAASTVGAAFLFILSIYLYCIKLNVIPANQYVTIGLFVAFTVAVSCGPLSVSMSVYSELIPIRSRNLSVCCIALSGKVLAGLFLKLAPLIIKTFGVHGTCLTFAIFSVITIGTLYKYLPETKDKTLQQINDQIMGVKPYTGQTTAKLIVDDKDVQF